MKRAPVSSHLCNSFNMYLKEEFGEAHVLKPGGRIYHIKDYHVQLVDNENPVNMEIYRSKRNN